MNTAFSFARYHHIKFLPSPNSGFIYLKKNSISRGAFINITFQKIVWLRFFPDHIFILDKGTIWDTNKPHTKWNIQAIDKLPQTEKKFYLIGEGRIEYKQKTNNVFIEYEDSFALNFADLEFIEVCKKNENELMKNTLLNEVAVIENIFENFITNLAPQE